MISWKTLIATFATLLLSVTVWAGKPISYTDEYPYFWWIADCGDFWVVDDSWEIDKVNEFYDKDGNFVRLQLIWTTYDDIYRYDEPEGAHLYGTSHVSARLEFDENGDEIWTQQGVVANITIPGYGPLFLDAGKVVNNVTNGWEIVFSAGKRHDWNFGEFEALCNYFE
jgi:hypothetical protein